MKLQFSGNTEDGKPVVSGESIFKLHDTLGFPMSMSFVECESRGYVVDWKGLLDSARSHKWPDFRIYDEIMDSLTESGAWRSAREAIKIGMKTLIMSQ